MKCEECRAYILKDHHEACAIARKPYQKGCLTAPGRIDQDLDHELERLPASVTDSWIFMNRPGRPEGDIYDQM